MNKKKVLIIFGTRPEAIKMSPLIKELQKHHNQFETLVCVTGQHREMLDQVLKFFEIYPDYDLNLMKPGQDLYEITSGVLLGIRAVIKKSRPDIVLVHGDTSTSTAAALAAYYQQIPVCHVEAGLRTNNIYSPFPEEMNRQITSRIAKYHFCPTLTSKQNLLKEGINENYIFITGNTVIDALFWVLDKIKRNPKLVEDIGIKLVASGLPSQVILNSTLGQPILNKTGEKQQNIPRKLVLITGHRRENFGEGFINICKAIGDLAEYHPDVDFVYPMHLNPNVRKPIKEIFGDTNLNNSNVHLIEPLDYLPFVYLMSKSHIILTDSGGIQEEAPSLGKPVLVMRDTTERPEAVDAGTVILVGTDRSKILRESLDLLENPEHYAMMSRIENPYGDGKASQKIIQFLLDQ